MGLSTALQIVGAVLFAAFARVRLFIMFHDCTHNAMFGTTADGGEFSLNERVGTGAIFE